MTILIADSGSTKTTWMMAEVDKGTPTVLRPCQTMGLNPLYTKPQQISGALDEVLSAVGIRDIDALYFYGAGCSGERIAMVEKALAHVLPTHTHIEVASDLLGACRALGTEICCIMGTGSIAALYDAETGYMGTACALGYILGDEGSGAVLGIRFVNALFKGQLPDELRQEFVTETGLSQDAIIQRVYRQPLANRFLASLSPFIHRHIDLQQVEALVIDHFRQFIRKNIQPYYDNPRLKEALPASPELHVTGSVGFHYQRQLAAAAALEGMRLGRVMGSPMEGLIGYHSSQSSPSTSL